ncbi:hypothetical protein ACFXTH_007384 [Malus domestica]
MVYLAYQRLSLCFPLFRLGSLHQSPVAPLPACKRADIISQPQAVRSSVVPLRPATPDPADPTLTPVLPQPHQSRAFPSFYDIKLI